MCVCARVRACVYGNEGLKRQIKFFTCAENESEKCTEASDTTAPPPTLPPLELDPVGESGPGAPQRRLQEEGEEEEEAGLERRKAGCEGLRAGVLSTGKEGLRGEAWRKESGD